MRRLRPCWNHIKDAWRRTSADRRASLVFELIIALSTSVYVGVALWQHVTMNQQLAAMKVANAQTQEALKVAQSPYVFVASVTCDPLTVGRKIRGSVQFVNTGNLPALNFFYTGEFAILSKGPTSVTAQGKLNVDEFDMPPNLSDYADQPPEPLRSLKPLSQKQLEGFKNGTEKLYAVGVYWGDARIAVGIE